MRIVLAPEGTRGDLSPMLVLGDALRARGHDVVVCAPPNFAEVATVRGFDFRPVGRDIHAHLVSEARAISGGSVLRFLGAVRRYSEESVRAWFAALPEAASGADLVVGAGVQMAAATTAERIGASYRYVIYCPGLLPSREHGPAILPFQPVPRRLRRLAWWASQGPFTALMARLVNRERRALGLPRLADAYRHLLGERPLLAADLELAPAPRDGVHEVVQVPALQPAVGASLPEKLADFLAAGPPPVYLGFGSMPDPDPVASTRMMLAAVERAGVRALLSTGWAGLGEGALPEGVMRVGDVDHALLFRRVAAVVHHGGAGTVTTAARAGAPQVVVPHVLDQFYWSDRVRALGLGVVAPRRPKLTAPALADAIAAVVDNETVVERCAEVAARIRARVPREPHPVEALLADRT